MKTYPDIKIWASDDGLILTLVCGENEDTLNGISKLKCLCRLVQDGKGYMIDRPCAHWGAVEHFPNNLVKKSSWFSHTENHSVCKSLN
jgi:hypothetical protein